MCTEYDVIVMSIRAYVYKCMRYQWEPSVHLGPFIYISGVQCTQMHNTETNVCANHVVYVRIWPACRRTIDIVY